LKLLSLLQWFKTQS